MLENPAKNNCQMGLQICVEYAPIKPTGEKRMPSPKKDVEKIINILTRHIPEKETIKAIVRDLEWEVKGTLSVKELIKRLRKEV